MAKLTGIIDNIISKVNDSVKTGSLGVADGVATLDSNGLVPATQLPSYVDDVLEYATYADLPGTGETGKIYIVVADENNGGDTSSYRWTGSVYALVSNSLTATDIKALYEGNADTNAFTDTLLAKLNGIEDGATADQTGTEIKALYEANANTNAFTDAEQSKLAGIEDGATADQTATEILDAIKTVDGSGSGLDADTLDGLDSTAFEPADSAIQSHLVDTANPHSVTQAQVGLGNVDNTSDANKPISIATQGALDLKADSANVYTTTELDNGQLDNRYYTEAELDVKEEALNTTINTEVSKTNKSLYPKSGYTTDTLPEDRWLETDTPNVIVDKVGDSYVIDGVVYEKTTTKQATLPLAPFATGSTDELLDVYTDGIKTNTPHSKGDIVVCNQFKELIFDGSTIIQSVSISPLSPFNSTVTFNISDPSFSEISNKLIYMEWKDVNRAVYNTTLTLTGTQILINTTAQFDEITSLRRTVANYTGDTIYQCIADAPTDTEVTNTSYFQTLDFVTRQDLIYLTATGYKTKKGVHSFTDKELVEGGSDLIASTYGYSKLGNGLYEIDGEKATALQVSGSRLNAGAYHPMFNKLGSKYATNTAVSLFVLWSVDSDRITSVYSSFVLNSGELASDAEDIALKYTYNNSTNRPDSKFYGKIYIKGENGLAPHSTFYAKDSEFGSDRGLTGLSSGITIDKIYPRALRFEDENTSHRLVKHVDDNSTIDMYGYGYPFGTQVILLNPSLGVTVYAEISSSSSYMRIAEKEGLSTQNPIEVNTHTEDLYDASSGWYLIVTKKHPQLLTYGESLTVDMIGDPSNYPSEWKSYLAGGGVTSINPLLVGQDGADYTSGAFNAIVSNKATVLPTSSVYFDVSTNTYTNATGRVVDNVNNTLYIGNASFIWFYHYTSYNTPYTQIDPVKITKVNPKVIASNSHSVYKGGLVVQDATGKIATGNGDNGYESRVLENVNVGAIPMTAGVLSPPLKNGDTYYMDRTFVQTGYWKFVGSDNNSGYAYPSASDFEASTGWEKTVGLIMIPTHSTITLDNSDSPSAKWFKAECVFSDGGKGECVFSEEMVWDYDVDYNNIVTYTAGSGAVALSYLGQPYKLIGFNNQSINNKIFTDIADTTIGAWAADTFDSRYLGDDGYIRNTSDGNHINQKLWDGNGFGDDDTFEQLTNGTLTDLNGNTVKTKILGRRY